MKQYDPSISLIRLMAMLFIVLCHFMQYLQMELAWWFNVGVQIFLCISGYLYGNRNTIHAGSFYRKTFTKILFDYELVVFPALIASFLLLDQHGQLTWPLVVGTLLTLDTIDGGQHLWFIPTILMCYLLTPLYHAFLSRIDQKSAPVFWSYCMFLLILHAMVFHFILTYFNPAWISCYLFGFVLHRITRYRTQERISVLVTLTLLGIICNGIQISVRYLSLFPLPEKWTTQYYLLCDYAHVLLGVLLFAYGKILFTTLLKNGVPNWLNHLLNLSNRYSYDIYLVHHFWILGPFSLMACTSHLWINICIVLLLTAISAFLVKNFADGLRVSLKSLR